MLFLPWEVTYPFGERYRILAFITCQKRSLKQEGL